MTCRCGLPILNIEPHLRDCCRWECRACADRAVHTAAPVTARKTTGLYAPREKRQSLQQELDHANNVRTVSRAKIEQLRRLVGGKT
jgi:hypothetical protein